MNFFYLTQFLLVKVGVRFEVYYLDLHFLEVKRSPAHSNTVVRTNTVVRSNTVVRTNTNTSAIALAHFDN